MTRFDFAPSGEGYCHIRGVRAGAYKQFDLEQGIEIDQCCER